MNPTAILALISDLYAQLTAAQERVAELEAKLEAKAQPQPNGSSSVAADPAVPAA